ncbi:alpha/beta-hydrolase [Coniochaeta ligniaria NRRL 30616]|uniref:Alpha/beta-hydrolase n=1 Tax=Coniochaeta ligniaria NRRL 30616 TaxID=1408157 RepID=A0A1J7IMI3_9PEZI|nr:alpha/beta-hydrolase [Coniochaeta ligniaria NRRL 30616]
MDASIPAVPSVPRQPRDRERDRTQASSRRTGPPHAISTAEANRDRDQEVYRSRNDRVRDPYSSERHAHKHPDRPPPPIPSASPEVISSLITSLSVISKPASDHFDNPSYFDPRFGSRTPNTPGSPTTVRSAGSFGVDYGAFSQPSLNDLQEEDVPLEELPASPPVIRTAKPPSGFSPLTAPKSPKSPGSRDASGFKTLLSGKGSSSALNVSRPSSRGSLASVAESIGNLSVERHTTSPLSESKGLRNQRSHDSWGKKTGRSSKGLMYMSSKERLREKSQEKKRASVGAVGGGSSGPSPGNNTISARPDPFFAESVINEEPHTDSPPRPERNSGLFDGNNGAGSPRPIPTRDSSLRKTGSNSKKLARTSRSSKRDSETLPGETIQEIDEHSPNNRVQRGDVEKRRSQSTKQGAEAERLASSLELPRRTKPDISLTKAQNQSYSTSHTPAGPASPMSPALDIDPLEEGAPFPAVAQGRRRDRDLSSDGRNRRRSGRQTPDASGYISEGGGGIALKLKRSSSRLKRLSGAASPTPDKRSSDRGSRQGIDTQTDQPHVTYERPPSADSIDDAVESYLCSPRLSQKIRHPQTGRVISFSEVGDPNGSAVFCCVGMGLTRYITAFYDELALTLKLRLITPDRPGVGDSEPYAEGTATPLGWPDDVYAICQSLKITKFSILAHSAGAIYALATALRMPQHIRGRIHLLAPWIPPSQMSVFGASAQTPLPPTNAIPTSQRILRALPTPFLKAANSSFMSATSSSITSSLPKQKRARRDKRASSAAAKAPVPDDKENHDHAQNGTKNSSQFPSGDRMNAEENMDRIHPTGTMATSDVVSSTQTNTNGHRHQRSNSSTAARRQAEKQEQVLAAAANLVNSQLADKERQETYDTRLTHAIWQLATTGANPAVDLLVCLERRHTIGFRYVDITRPVVIHHGSRDTRVPVENVKWLGKTMRRCEVRVLEGEGHGLMASAQVMGNVLMEISHEWEEWGRVTGATKRETEKTRRGTIGQAR